jgi:hypothetical protein
MALLFMDSFDHMGTLSPVTLGKWASSTGGACTTSLFRTGAASLGFSGAGTMTTKTLTTSGGAVVGAAVYVAGGIQAADIFEVLETAIVHVAVGITAGGLLTIKRGSTVLATGTTVIAASSWTYIELKTVIGASGSYEVRINGVTELINGSVNTQNGGTGVWNSIQVSNFGSGVFSYFDDFYICDTSGSAPRNTFLGLVKVDMIMPQTDAVQAGSNAGLTPSTGTDHGACVDDNPPNTTDWNSSSTVGAKDTYQYPNMNLSGTILGIQTNLYVNKTDAGVRSVAAVVREGSTDYPGANVNPLTTFSYFTEIKAQNPNTSADWTTTDITNIQVGMQVTV